MGKREPGLSGVRISLEIVTLDARSRVEQLIIGSDGNFDFTDRSIVQQKGPGLCVMQAYLRGHDLLANTDSEPVEVKL